MDALDAPRLRPSLRRATVLAGMAGVVAAVALVLALVLGRDESPPPPQGQSPRPGLLSLPDSARATRVPAGAHYVSRRGSDSAPGTRRRPWRTLRRALERVQPGETVVVAPGTYGARGTTTDARRNGTPQARITIMGQPGARRPIIRGFTRLAGSHLRVSGLVFAGPTGRVQPSHGDNPGGEQVVVTITGDDVTISDSVIRDGAWHAGIYVDGADGTRIVGNHIHDNGNRSDPSQANVDHGIYWARGSGQITNNVIERNVARGIQLYPRATNVVVSHNTIVGNGRAGIQLGAQSSGNLVANNIVAFNRGSGIRSASLAGGGNRVLNNLVWSNDDGNIGPETDGLSIASTIVADPRLHRGTYCPQRGSPALDRGLAAYAPSQDYRGTRRQRSGADLGACELTRRERGSS
jgi:parallel beta-helix repeat protein